MLEHKIKRLDFLLSIIPALLKGISEEQFSVKSRPDKWSKKEILGHLIDSATNNHHRFVRGQFEDVPSISYNQEEWNKYGFYNKIGSSQLISFWEVYNRQLLSLIRLMPEESKLRKCNIAGKEFTIEFLFIDYVDHLEHHLKQIVYYGS